MKLAQLLNESRLVLSQKGATLGSLGATEIRQFTLDSRRCDANTVYVAANGYIDEALKRSALAIVTDDETQIDAPLPVPVLIAPDARKFIAEASERLQGFPSHQLQIVGITGTNGKTTTSFFLASIFKHAGLRAGVVGTFGTGDIAAPRYNGYTTPEAEILSPALRELKDEGFTHIAMEVSSHALALSRCDGLRFCAAAFLNLSPEHLDFHPDMADYRRAKERLFLELLPPKAPAVIAYGDALVQKLLAKGRRVVTFGRNAKADVSIDADGAFVIGQERALVKTPIVGDFNLDNLLCAMALAHANGLDAKTIFAALPFVVMPPGRLERVAFASPAPTVIVDFSHKPEALEKALNAVRALKPQSLKLVFGCGGNRDPFKRPVMGEIAARLADEVWITNDNPRHEDPRAISDAIWGGVAPALQHKCHVVLDRAQAIAEAIRNADVKDVILIAGKGDESTQQIGDEYLPFKDKDVARASLELWQP